MARRPGDMGGNHPGNPLGQHAPSFPTPAINSELVQPVAVAPQSSYLFRGTVPQGHHGQLNPLFQQNGGAGRIHNSSRGAVPPPLHGTELAAPVAGLNNMPSQPFHPNGHVIGWPLAQMYDPRQTQQQQVPRYPGPEPEPIGPSDRGASAWGQLPLPQPARDARFMQKITGAVAPPYGSRNAGAPPIWSNHYRATSRAPRPTGTAARTRELSEPTKSFEEFLRDQGIPVPIVADELPFLDNTADVCEAMLTELLGDPAEELGLLKSVDLVIRAGRNGPLAPALGFRSGGPTRDQLGLGTVRVPADPSFAAAAVGRGRAAATAAAREQRSKKQAVKKVAAAAAAKARAKKLAGTVPNSTLYTVSKGKHAFTRQPVRMHTHMTLSGGRDTLT
jgi:hypothetical protein